MNNDIERQIQNIYGSINGKGGFDTPNSDYFEGEFFGSVHDRYGHLTKIREDGSYCVGKWTNGLMEGIFDLTKIDGWTRYNTNGLLFA